MNYKIFNEDNLQDDEIDEIAVRIKAFILNEKNELLVALSNGGVQLIGGHTEEGEEHKETLKREITEEAGIEVLSEEISEPFFEIKHYIKNYYNEPINAIAQTIYYFVKTNKEPDLNKIKLTSREKDYEFHLKQVPFDEFEKFIQGFLDNEKEINRVIADEILIAFRELKKSQAKLACDDVARVVGYASFGRRLLRNANPKSLRTSCSVF